MLIIDLPQSFFSRPVILKLDDIDEIIGRDKNVDTPIGGGYFRVGIQSYEIGK